MTENGEIFLIDFECASMDGDKYDNMKMDGVMGTIPYMAPELLFRLKRYEKFCPQKYRKQTQYSSKSDIWSLGILMVEIYVGCQINLAAIVKVLLPGFVCVVSTETTADAKKESKKVFR